MIKILLVWVLLKINLIDSATRSKIHCMHLIVMKWILMKNCFQLVYVKTKAANLRYLQRVFQECQRLLCYNHFDKNACDCQRAHINPSCEMQPKQYEVDGLPKLEKKRKVPEKVSIRKLSKENWNSGKAYISIQSCQLMPARWTLKARRSWRCTDRSLCCDTFWRPKK